MGRIRTFIAIDISAGVRAEGERLQRSLARCGAGGSWVRPENLHLTMKFLGDVDERDLAEVCRQLADVAAQFPSFSVVCRSVGAFPRPSKPSTLWMGILDDEQQLHRLHAEIEASLDSLGFPCEHRRFQAHITLGRLRRQQADPAATQEFLAAHADEEFGSFSVEQLVLYRSDLSHAGPDYTPIGRFPLG